MSYEPPPLEPELAQLETELRTLRPLPPRFRLSKKLTRALEEPPAATPPDPVSFLSPQAERVGWLPWRRYAPAAAAAAAIIVAIPALAPQDEPALSMQTSVAPAPLIPPAIERRPGLPGGGPPRVEMIFPRSPAPPRDLGVNPHVRGADASEGWRPHDNLPNDINVFIPDRPAASAFPEATSPFGFLGVRLHAIPDYIRAQLQHLNLGETTGLLVCDVGWNGPAHRAGISIYDIISGLNGQPVTSAEDFIQRIRKTQPGTDVELEIVRGGRRTTVRLTLIPAPSA